jgi:ribosomal protein L11 methyltransferase
MKYLEVAIKTTHEASELVSDILYSFTDEGVSIEDAFDIIDLEKLGKTWDYIEEGVITDNETVTVKAFIKIEEKDKLSEIEKALNNLKENCPFSVGELSILVNEIDGDKWREDWKKYFKPIHLGKIVIVPGWIEYQKKEDEIVVIMDSNMAFGTGEHETTSMCVEFLGKYIKGEETVLDVGCGSGILGICASKLGAKEVIMTDIDECAIVASEHNMTVNNIKNGTVLLKNLLDDNSVKGEVIVCNIMAEVLIAFAPYIGNNLKEKGVIILSGILVDRMDKVISAYENNGFTLLEKNIKGEWSALVFTK